MASYAKGHTKYGGRKPGKQNYYSSDVGTFARRIVEDEAYLVEVSKRAHAGTLAPGMESMLWHYAYGKPREQPSRDDEAFIADLMAMVLKHVGNAKARREIRGLIEAHTGQPGVRLMAL